MDDPTLADLTRTNNPALQGWQAPGLTPEQQARFDAYAKVAGSAGPGGYSPMGLPLSWVPADAQLRQEFMGAPDSRQHFGQVVDDPVLGRIQSTYRDPPKPNIGQRYMPLAFGAALAAISGGAAMPLLGTLFSAATQYGSTGKLNPTQLALQTAAGFAPGLLGGIDPALRSAYDIGSKAYGIGKAGYDASKGNYGPAAGIGLNQLTRGLG
jgi:hypothetical protein